MSQYIGDDDSDLKQLSEDPNYTPPKGSPTLAQQAVKSAAKQPKPAVKSGVSAAVKAPTSQSKSLSFLATAEGHLPALPITLAVVLLALGAGMAVYRASR